MKILYAGTLSFGESARFRRWALERLGHEVIPFEVGEYESKSSLVRKMEFRLAAGPAANRLNKELLEIAEREKPDLFWADKVLKLQPSTLTSMRAMGITTVSYMIDNAFGPRNDPGWRLHVKTIPFFDLHVTQREVSVADYLRRGARHVVKVQTAFEPTIHFAPPTGWSDRDREREVSFIGTPYDDRAHLLSRLAAEGFTVSVSGRESAWKKALLKPIMEKIYYGGLLYEDAYREAIWRSKINLSFLTRANLDEYAHKSFEIAACGGFLLAERSPGHLAKFVEGEEAVFFDGYDELQEKICRYLPDERARRRIAAAGRERALRDGYDNDTQVARILERVEAIAAERQGVAAAQP